MSPNIEKREDGPETDTATPLSDQEFYTLIAKNPRPVEEIALYTPRALPLLEIYHQDLAIFLTREPIITNCHEARSLRGHEEQLKADFQLQRQASNNARQELTRQLKETLREEKTTERRIANEVGDPRTIWDRFRTKLYQRRSQPGRKLREKVAAAIPGFPIPQHPLLVSIIQEEERLQMAMKIAHAEADATEERYKKACTPLHESSQKKQGELIHEFRWWVTENPQRLLAHLVLLPDDIPNLRKAFHRRFAEDRETKMTLDAGLQGLGLLVKTSLENGVQTMNANHGKTTTTEQSISDNDWGFVFVEYDPDEVIRSGADLIKVVRDLLTEKGCPPKQINAIVRCLLRFQANPFSSGLRVDTVKTPALRDEVGKDKLYLPSAWRALFDLTRDEKRGRVIEVQRLIPHGKWEKKY